ncbi:MAG: hypothetical protein ABSG65_16325 [Bryobacteraceae bacterium]|jgi:hypothetical protein
MRKRANAVAAILVLALAGATPRAEPAQQEPTAAPAAAPRDREVTPAPSKLMVILLKPAIRFEEITAGSRSDFGVKMPTVNRGKNEAPGNEEDYQRLLIDAAKNAAGSKATILDSGTLEPSIAETCQGLASLGSRIARGNINEDALGKLARLAASDEHYAILAQFLRLEKGPGRSWDPNTGAIGSSTSSTLVQAALVSAKTGRVIWKNERLIRNKALRPADAALNKAIRDVYQDFDVQ